MEASTVEKGSFEPQAGQAALEDLQLSPEEAGEEAAERARALGEDEDHVAAQRELAMASALEHQELAAGERVPEPELHIPPDQIVLRVTAKAAPKFAGKQPGTTILSLKGVKFAVDGGFRKGETIKFTGSALVISEGARDRLDKETQMVSDSVQEHQAVVLDLELLD